MKKNPIVRGISLISIFSACMIIAGREGSTGSDNILETIKESKDLSGKKLVISLKKVFPDVPCMGLGDQFQFVGPYAEWLQTLGADVVTDSSKVLIELFDKTSAIKTVQKLDSNDLQQRIPVELADLYAILGNKVPTFARTSPWLKCPHDLIIAGQKKMLKQMKKESDLPVILFTTGNVQHNANRFPDAATWNILTDKMDGTCFFNCQFNKGADINNTIRPSAFDKDFDKTIFIDTMGMIGAAMYLFKKSIVISPDTGTLHLAASIAEGTPEGKDRVWYPMLQEPDQRWHGNYTTPISKNEDGVIKKKTVWYPQSVVIYQQTKNDWKPVIKKMKEDLQRIAAKKA